jgi:hypothetical protein
MIGWLVIFAALAISMVIAMVPYSFELLTPSKDAAEHRRRLASMGPIGRITGKLVPLSVSSPAKFWGTIYFVCWAALLAMMASLVSMSAPGERLHNGMVGFGIAAIWLALHWGIISLARALRRANQQTHSDAAVAIQSVADEAAAPEDSAEAKQTAKPNSGLRFLEWMVIIGLLIAIRAAPGYVPTLRVMARAVHAHFYAAATVVAAVGGVGLLLFVGGCFSLLLKKGRPMSEEELDRFNTQMMRILMGSQRTGVAAYKFKGEQMGREGHDEFSLRAMKAAWRSGVWWANPTWRRRYLTFAGAMLSFAALLGLISLHAPAWVMLLCATLYGYILLRTSWAFWWA